MFGYILGGSGDDGRAPDPAGGERNLALDEALARAAPTVAVLWCWQNPECVVVGRGQRIEREVDVSRAVRDGVAVFRRCSGGGTVFHDEGNLNVTLVLPGRAGAALGTLARVLVDTMSRLGVTAAATDRGLFAGGRKLAGFAALHASNATLAHASVLVNTPAERVSRYLTAAPETPHPLDSSRSPVGPLNGHGIHREPAEVAEVVRAVVVAEFGAVVPRSVNPSELGWQRRLLHTRYRHPAWHSKPVSISTR
jgi:lipoate-protein ligase A